MKDIVILANFCSGLDGKGNGRFVYLANMLKENHKVEIVTSDFDHGKKKKAVYLEPLYPFKITLLHESGYKKNICAKRLYSHNVWGRNVAKYLKKRKKPDIIYCAVPSLTAALKAARYCKKNSVRFVIDIQDLWPEAFRMVLNIPVLSYLFFLPFRIMANSIYKAADDICAVSDTYAKRAFSVNKKCKTYHSVFLGTKLREFDLYAKSNIVYKKPAKELWLAYCGTLGHSYDLKSVIDALALLNQKGIRTPRFFIMGDGPCRQEFEKYAEERRVEVCFAGMLPYSEMCALLGVCDIVVNPIRHGAAQSIINKHADYAAAGLPVLNTQENKEYRQLVEKYEMGYNCENGNVEDLAEKMLYLIQCEELRKRMGENARKCAEQKFDREKSYDEIVSLLAGGGGEKLAC